MSKILVVMDQSSLSINALKYAISMCPDGYTIDILHVMSEVISLSEAPLLLNWPELKDIELQKLKSFIELKYIDAPWEILSINVVKGDIVHSVHQWCEDHTYDYIIAGTRDKYDLVDKLIGTISLGIVKTTKNPIYLIPPQISYNGYKHIRVAIDHMSDMKAYCHKIINWNKNHRAHLTLTYVRRDDEDAFKQIKEDLITIFYEHDAVDFSFDIEGISGDNITQILMSNTTDVDLLILKSNKQSFFNSLFVKSLSKEIILNSRIPILFFK